MAIQNHRVVVVTGASAGVGRATVLGDRYLARTGFDSQQTDQPADPDRPDNLWHPLPGDHGAHGRFGSRSWNTSQMTWFDERLPAIAGGIIAGVALWAAGRWIAR